jgi:hypothetical protein
MNIIFMKAVNVETAILVRSKYSHQLKTGPPGFNEFNSCPDGELSGFGTALFL